MKRYLLIILIINLTVSFNSCELAIPDNEEEITSEIDLSQWTWESRANLQDARRTFASAVYDNKVYVFGGQGPNVILNTVEMYNPETDSWIYKSPMPTERRRLACVVYDNKIYCIGGKYHRQGISQSCNVLEVYDPETDTWEKKSNMITPRWDLMACVVEDKIYVISGIQSESHRAVRKLEVYDPLTDTWTSKNEMPVSFRGAACAVVNHKIYVYAGMETIPNLYTESKQRYIWEYAPEKDTWSRVLLIPADFWRYYYSLLHIEDKIYLFGGRDWNSRSGFYSPSNTILCYVPEKDSIAAVNQFLPEPWWGGCVEQAGRQIFILGGLYVQVGGWTELATVDALVNYN